ncbi:MAG: acyl-CoA dehydrogenase family protein [Actinobacteria bacterium]|nr:acyl-CoA dehydrogenase family protein [Actinomycetota bacterium]
MGEALKVALDGPYHPLRQKARDTLTAAEILRDPTLSVDEARAWTLAALQHLATKGYGNTGFALPGQAADPATVVTGFEALAHGDLSLVIKVGVQYGLWGGAIEGLGTDEQVSRWLPDILSARHLGCFAMTEMGHGSDVASIETTLTYDPETDEIVVDSPTPTATKTYIGNAAAHGTSAAVFGQLWVDGTCHGVHCVVVPFRTVVDGTGQDLPGCTSGDNGHKGGLLGIDNGTLRFDHVRVPRANLLSRYGGIGDDGSYSSPISSPGKRFFTMLGTLVRGRVCVGAGAAIAGRRALSIATRYALRRAQFPGPDGSGETLLLDYRWHQRRLLPGIAKAYAFGFANNDLIHLLARSRSEEVDDLFQRSLESRAAGLKAAQSRWANDIVQVCREACGGAGFMTENGLTLLRSDVDIFATFEGDNTVLMQLVARGLLTGYQETWTGLDRRETMTKTADLVARMVLERTAGRGTVDALVARARRVSNEASILDRGWQVLMFDERERHVLESLARRYQAAMRVEKAQRFAAVNELQDHLLTLARVHTDRLVLGSFVAGIEACEDPAAKRVLNTLCDLYVIDNLEGDRAWFIEHGFMTQARSKSLTKTLNRLCAELRPEALALVEGLGVPAEWLGSRMLED